MTDAATLPKPEKRKPLTRLQFATLILKQEGKCGCGCGMKLQADRIIDEHLQPLDALGSNDLSNRALFSLDCAKRKTQADRAARDKGRRIRKRAERGTCVIDGCKRSVKSADLCQRHYLRKWRHGDALAGGRYQTAPGEKQQFMHDSLLRQTDECIEWPYPYNAGTGYGDIHWQGRGMYVHRVVCILAHGEPPKTGMVAAHSCGNRRCFNHRHLRWATHVENEADKLLHGTTTKGKPGRMQKLTEEDLVAIREAKGKQTQRELAEQYGVHQVTISEVQTGKYGAWAGNGPKRAIVSRNTLSLPLEGVELRDRGKMGGGVWRKPGAKTKWPSRKFNRSIRAKATQS